MNSINIKAGQFIGIAVRTTNENGQAAKDIPALWQKFHGENIHDKIPNKKDPTVYCMYTDYEKDHTRPYTTIIGCRVDSLDNIPEGMVAKTVEGGNYQKFPTKGDVSKVVIEQWMNIWNANLPRTFSTDFEVYGEKAMNPADAEVDILIAVE